MIIKSQDIWPKKVPVVLFNKIIFKVIRKSDNHQLQKPPNLSIPLGQPVLSLCFKEAGIFQMGSEREFLRMTSYNKSTWLKSPEIWM